MKKLKKDIKKFLNIRNVLIILVLLIAALLWFRYVTGLVLVAVFAPITFLSVRYSKMVPHISIESNTAMSCFMGYVYGPFVGFIYGIAVGGFSYTMNSFVSITYLSTVFLGALAAFVTGSLAGLTSMHFSTAFFIAIIFRTVVGWPWFSFVGVDPFESFTHQVSQMFFNLIIYLPLLSAVYDALRPFLS